MEKTSIDFNEIYERYCLALDRIREIPDEVKAAPAGGGYDYLDFFVKKAEWITNCLDGLHNISIDTIKDYSVNDLARINSSIYKDISEDYDTSYSNPNYSEDKLGIYGQILSFVSAELMTLPSLIMYVKSEDIAETDISKVTYLLELFLYLYGLFNSDEKPTLKELESAVYYYAFDYIEEIAEDRLRENTFPNERSVGNRIIREADITDPSYLYLYGDYISDTEVSISSYLASLPEERILDIAKTFCGGFRRGFDVMGVNFEGKRYVNIRYHIGMERIVRAAVGLFSEMGLEPVLNRSTSSRLVRKGTVKTGFESTSPNMQFEFDHRMDDSFFMDKRFIQRRVDATREAYEKIKEDIKHYAGPAVIESFGEALFSPVVKDSAPLYSDEATRINVELYSKLGALSNEYLPGDEYSFTIIAFPLPDIGDDFEEIFNETMVINTLDNDKYIKIQQSIIDVLDKADHARVIGMNGNQTDMSVKLRHLENPDKETEFENCTADVNIPLGEVFTSPVLKGTHGTLNVKSSYLNGYTFKNLTIRFEDGVVTDYTCDLEEDSSDKEALDKNSAEKITSDENAKKYIKNNILFNHETLPIGEFAIGTNTYAYSMAVKYDILEKLPILIVEKTGPHFALGDTCYSHAEDHAVFNPDGKEIICRENDFSLLRHTEPEKAYFNCHTDITIPYNELGLLTAVMPDGTEVDIIKDGRFVLEGTEELNEALM
ncbi:MAG: aminopeptidase [Eubacterium sp.]|nr:aminopeptidase [Eubacterium sp.]